MTTLWQRAQGLIEAEFNALEGFFTGSVWPQLKTFLSATVEEELVALEPLALQVVAELVLDGGALFTPAGWAAAVATTIVPLAEKAKAQGLEVAGASLHTALATALANTAAAVVAPK